MESDSANAGGARSLHHGGRPAPETARSSEVTPESSLRPGKVRKQSKAPIFLLEALNSLATGFYFNYLFFFLKYQFGFTGLQNLLVCALNGFVYMFFAYAGGQAGQRRGYLWAVGTGVAVMMIALAGSMVWQSIGGLLFLMIVWTVGMCFTWPNLEALATEKEAPSRVPRYVGIYNCVWALAYALAYFAGGAIIGKDFQWARIFWVPVVLHGTQLLIIYYLANSSKSQDMDGPPEHAEVPIRHPEARAFLKLAWLANPFAYIAINAVIPLIPEVALRLGLSPESAGFFCSIWFFSRFATFVILALWPGWHYHFGYLLSSYVGLIICFVLMLILQHLWAVIVVQVLLGWCLGVIYYSSLYYSMDAGEQKGAHGGVHEAALGAGIFAGPAIGALAIYAFPAWPQSSVWAVALVLVAGLGALIYLRRTSAKR